MARSPFLQPESLSPRSQPESRKLESGWRRETDGTNDKRVRITSPLIDRANSPYRKEEDPKLQRERLRAEFYKNYQKEAEEYDRGFTKKCDDDLNTTLIFVSSARRPDTRVLSLIAGRPVFRCDFRIHRPDPCRIPEPERRDERTLAYHSPKPAQQYL